MHAFIVRPFGTKGGVDFERVERELIDPVLTALGIPGRTTGEIAAAGNIRLDMFERLVTADLVIADISIHNANVFYELGIRHALRARRTILIRARRDEVPFDVKTDRYLAYDGDDPAAALPELKRAVLATLEGAAVDSPVHLLLPELPDLKVEGLAPVPPAFLDAVASAKARGDGALLGLLGDELRDVRWELAGRRHVGRAQGDLKLFTAARATWGRVLELAPGDVEAPLRQGTVLQRLGETVASTNALRRVLSQPGLSAAQRAEARALIGSNLKTQWAIEVARAPADRRQATALASSFLHDARAEYAHGFREDLNHYYSGLNALALTVLTLDLVEVDAAPWEALHDEGDEAAAALRRLRTECGRLGETVRASLDAAAARDPHDAWLEASRADVRFLTNGDARKAAAAYKAARERFAERGEAFHGDSVARQLRLFLALGLRADACRAALGALGLPEREAGPSPPPHVIAFTGHRVDELGRAEPRFPRTPEAEAAARAAIDAAVRQIVDEARAAVTAGGGSSAALVFHGVAGGASGGDLLFHEVCDTLGIPTILALALPPDRYRAASVDDSGGDWGRRFEATRAIREAAEPPRVRLLAETEDPPPWLQDGDAHGVWTRNNIWMLHMALARPGTARVTLVAFWNGRGGDGPGGTADMIALAARHGVRTVRIDAAEVLGTG